MSLEARHVSFSYDGKRSVLDDISFRIGDGQMVCLLGPNGVGKTTLFKIILRLLKGYTGSILIGGEDTAGLNTRQMARRIAYIPQSHAPTFNYTVREMVLMGTTSALGAYASPGEEQAELSEKVMRQLGIDHLKDRGFSRISGGERQLALIARALVQQTGVLIMDEPTANLDYGNATIVLEQIRKLAGEGYTILQATHQPDQAFLFADQVLAIYDGRVLAQGKPKDVITEEFIRKLYGVQVDVQSLYGDQVRVCVPVSALRKRGNDQKSERGNDL